MSDIDRPVSRILESYKAAVFAKDADALMRLYDPAVRVFDAWGSWSHEGARAWRQTVDGWFTSLTTERVKVSFDDVKVIGGPDVVSVSAFVTYAGVAADGEQLRTMTNRISWVLRLSGHVLRIVHEHTSAPIGFEDAKAILERPVAA